MLPDFDQRLRALAEVIVRIGLNLQPGQRLLITDPYELHGIHPETKPLALAAQAAAGNPVEIVTAAPHRLRSLAAAGDLKGYSTLVENHTRQLRHHLAVGGAFLFVTGSHPGLLAGAAARTLQRMERIKWQHLGPLIQRLIAGSSQWTLVPGPTKPWADVAFPDLPEPGRLAALWDLVFGAFRVGGPTSFAPEEALAAWTSHLGALARRRDELNSARLRRVCYTGLDTELIAELPKSHVWCTAQQSTTRDVPFVVNLPTEEIFTAPHRHRVNGRVRISRPVAHAGETIDGINLEIAGGKVVAAHATRGQELLRQLLKTDDGACRLGEIAIVPERNRLSLAGRCFHHTLFDENATNHIALGDGYRFCSRAWFPWSLNSSQIHVDLPLDATISF